MKATPTKENFEPYGLLILVEPLKTKYRTETQTVLDDEANEGKDPMKDEMEVKEVKNKVKLNHQLGKVISIGNGLTNPKVKVGDIIMYDINSMRESDLMKKAGFITDHNILGIVKENIDIDFKENIEEK